MGQKDPDHVVKAFFAWLLNQRREKGGRRVKALGSEDSMKTYYKYFRVACERATGEKMGNGSKGFDCMVRRVSQLALPPRCFPPGRIAASAQQRHQRGRRALPGPKGERKGGGGVPGRPSTKQKGTTPVQEVDPQVAAAKAKKQALDAATLSVFEEERLTICFLCLAKSSLSPLLSQETCRSTSSGSTCGT